GNRDRLDQLANRLTSATGRSIEVVAADLGNKADVRRIEEILRSDSSITMLVNNAGIGGAGPLLVSDVDTMEAMIDLNVTSLTRLTYGIAAAVAAWEAVGQPHQMAIALTRAARIALAERAARDAAARLRKAAPIAAQL